MSKTSLRRLTASLLCAALGLAACVEDLPETQDFSAALTPSSEPTAEVTPTTAPALAPLEFVTYRHKSGVFSLSQPKDWEALDSSTDQRLSVRFIPPPGFGSRVIVEATNEGVLTPEQMRQKAESFIALNIAPHAAYEESNRSELPDGRLQIIYLYDDGRGGTGRETLTFQQVGPFLIALRAFLADADQANLSDGLNTMASSLIVDPQAAWGTSVAAINPAELLIANTTLWQNGLTTYYVGDIYNASPAAAANVKVQVTLCDRNGVALVPLSVDAGLRTLDKGGTVPFMAQADNMPRGVQVCLEQASGEPAKPDPDYTTAMSLTVAPSINNRGRLVLDTQVANPGLAPVKNIHLVLTVYDAEGKAVGYGSLVSDADILLFPGQIWTISHVFETLGGKADHYVALAEAQIVNPSNPSLNP